MPIARSIDKRPMGETFNYAGAIRAIFHGCDNARFLKIILDELLFGNEGLSINTVVWEWITITLAMRLARTQSIRWRMKRRMVVSRK